MPKRNWYQKESIKASYLLKRLFRLKIVYIALFSILLVFLAPIVVFIALRPRIQTNINYGVNFSDKYARDLGLDWKDTYLKVLDDLGAKNLRLVAYWEDIEVVNDQFDYSNIRWQLDQAKARDVDVILAIGRKVPRYPECFEPDWWNDLVSEEVRNLELYEFLKRTVEEFKDYENISKWQVENEPFFPFGECVHEIKQKTVEKEVEIVKEIDDRPIVIQDSGEGGFWFPSYKLGDYLAISMYRKIWYDFWGFLGGDFIYFKYPLAHWTYAVKAGVAQVPHQRIIVTELQAEPWGPGINSELSDFEKDRTMSRNDFYATIDYAQRAGFRELYFWGAEWWFWEKEINNNPFYWDTAKALFR